MTEVLLAKTAVSAWLIQPCLGCWSQPPRRCCYASIPLLHTLTWMTCLSGTTAMPTPSTCAGTSYISLLSPLPPISQQPVHLVNLIIRPAGVAQSVERVALIITISSTSRSRVRAPPSAIPSHTLSVLFAVCYGSRKAISDALNKSRIFGECQDFYFSEFGARTFSWARFFLFFSHLSFLLRILSVHCCVFATWFYKGESTRLRFRHPGIRKRSKGCSISTPTAEGEV